MGMRVSWISFLGNTKEEMLEKLGLSDTLEADEFFEEDIVCGDLLGGNALVFFNDYMAIERLDLTALSMNGSLIALNVHETTMSVKVTQWTNGIPIWSIVHEGHLRIDHLVTQGDLPETYDAIHSAQVALQKDDDDCDFYFEIPNEVAKSICGFRHDAIDPDIFLTTPTIAISTT